MPQIEIDSAYLHIGNSGFTFAVVDEGNGPTIHVRFTAFGHEQHLTLHTTTDAIAAVGEMFMEASKHPSFSQNYTFAAHLHDPHQKRLMRTVIRLRREGRHDEADILMGQARQERERHESRQWTVPEGSAEEMSSS